MVEDVIDGELLWKTNASWPAEIDTVQVALQMQGCSLYSLTISADPCLTDTVNTGRHDGVA